MAKVTAGREQLGDFAPKFAQLNDDVLFGEVWSREEQLSARDRSIVTVTALMASGCSGQLFTISYSKCESWRCNKRRNGRNTDPCRFLRRMAKGVGSVSICQRNL